jgi:2-polyprenyl-3-methyl-5-hydroxy-6-metoxy-1,4-benzoquinol methylase
MNNYVEENIENTIKIMSKITPKRYNELRVNRYIPIMNLIIPYTDKKGYLLDIGTREGAFLDVLKENGFENLCGVDIYEDGVREANSKGHVCKVMDAQNLSLGVKFDTITALHVLEHCPDVKKVLDKIYDHLVNNGILCVEVPKEECKECPNYGHYSFFPSLNDLASVFLDGRWEILELVKNQKNGKRLRILLRRLQ